MKKRIRSCGIGLLSAAAAILLSGCSPFPGQSYSDNYPEPCSPDWFVAVDEQLQLSQMQAETSPGSGEWLEAVDQRFSISLDSGYPAGHMEWCHTLHQRLIGL